MATKTSDPKHIDISLSQGIKIIWLDGHESQYGLMFLRKNCPCATCRHEMEEKEHGAPAAGPFQMFTPNKDRLKSAEAVGRYAIRLLWADGHDTGIYSFDLLRDLCNCARCKAARPVED